MTEKTIRILLVEDNPADYRMLREILADVGIGSFEVFHAARLEDALDRANNESSFDAVLLDLSLPDSQGLTTIHRCRAAMPMLPIVVLTGLDDETLGIQALRSGAQEYLVKGQVDSRLLVRTIGYARERRRMEVLRANLMEQLREARDELEKRVQERTADLHRTVETLQEEVLARRQAEKSLRESNARQKLILEQLPALVWTTDGEFRFTSFAGTGTDVLGASPEAMLGKSVQAAASEDARLLELAEGHRRAVLCDAVSCEISGAGRYHQAHVEPLYDAEEQIIGCIGFALDVTRLKQTQQAVAEQARILEAFFSSTVNPVVFLDREFNFIRVNQAYAESCARHVSEFAGRNHFDLYPSPGMKELFEEVVWTRKPYQAIARPFVFPDHPEWGVTYWDWSLVPILDEKGEVDFLVFSLNDVTARKEAENSLRESEERFRTVFERAPVGVALVSLTGRLLRTNHALQEMVGYTEDEMVTRTLVDLAHAEDVERDKDLFAELTGGRRDAYELERRFARKDGQWVWVQLSLSLIRDNTSRPSYAVALIADITERRQTEKQMAHLMETEHRRLGQELHDGLAQQIIGLGMMARGLHEKLKAASSQHAGAAAELCTLIREAQSQSRAMLKGLRPVEVDANGLMSAMGDLVSGTEKWYGIRCTFKCDRPVPVEDNSVATQLFYIGREAVTNAVRHAKAKHIEVRLGSKDDYVTLQVRDDGVGIPRERKGGGMGMRIMRHRAGMIGAAIEICPASAGGTIVSCTLKQETHDGHEQNDPE